MPTPPFDPGYYDEYQLRDFGFAQVGDNVRIARNCTIVGVERICLGNNVRIDGYTTIMATGIGPVDIGSFIHVGAYCLLSGGDGISLDDFSGLSQGVRVYSRTDDYSGEHLTNPMVPSEFTGVIGGPVHLGRHVVIGSGTVILPNLRIGDGSSVGAQSLVNRDLPEWGVYFGCPARRHGSRSRRLLELESELLARPRHD